MSEVALSEDVGAISVIDGHTSGIGTVADTDSGHVDVLTQVEVQTHHDHGLNDGVVHKVLAGATL